MTNSRATRHRAPAPTVVHGPVGRVVSHGCHSSAIARCGGGALVRTAELQQCPWYPSPCQPAPGLPMIRDLFQQSLRSLRNARGVTATSICLLATTIGAITAIYAIVHAVVLRPFGFADQDRLAVIWMRDDRRALPVIEVAYGEMDDWRARSRSFERQAVVGSVNWPLTLVDRAGTQVGADVGGLGLVLPGCRHRAARRPRSCAVRRSRSDSGRHGRQPRTVGPPVCRRSVSRRTRSPGALRSRRANLADGHRWRHAARVRFPARRGGLGACGAAHPGRGRVVWRARQRAPLSQGVLRDRQGAAGRVDPGCRARAAAGDAHHRPAGRPRAAAVDRGDADCRLPAGTRGTCPADAAGGRRSDAAHRLRHRGGPARDACDCGSGRRWPSGRPLVRRLAGWPPRS